MRVLIVEDYAPLRKAVAQGLTEAGYVVDAAVDGEEGLWHAGSGTYDVIVTNRCGPAISDPATLTVTPVICRGDCDCSGYVNFTDINYFVAGLAGGTNGESAWSAYYGAQHGNAQPCCPYSNLDANADSYVDFRDINPFVNLLLTQPACP